MKIKSFRSNENLRVIDPSVRQCYFEDEKELKFFKRYSKYHCELECFNEYKKTFYNCSTIDLPRIKNSTHKICFGVNITYYIKIWEEFSQKCGCQMNCNYVQYNANVKNYKWLKPKVT